MAIFWYFCYDQIINLWWDIQYLAYYIIHNTYKTQHWRGTAISVSGIYNIYNDIIQNVKEIIFLEVIWQITYT